MRIPPWLVLMCCAFMCAIAASIRNHGVDGLWAATVVFLILSGVVGHAGTKTKAERK